MSELLRLLPLLACPLGMGAMMWFMMRSGRKATDAAPMRPKTATFETDPRHAELAALHEQVDNLHKQKGDQSETRAAAPGST